MEYLLGSLGQGIRSQAGDGAGGGPRGGSRGGPTGGPGWGGGGRDEGPAEAGGEGSCADGPPGGPLSRARPQRRHRRVRCAKLFLDCPQRPAT